MSEHKVHVNFPGRIVFVGFGSIGQGVLPLIMRHIGTSADRITIVSADERGAEVATHYGVKFIVNPILPGNLESTLTPLVGTGDFLINVSTPVSSLGRVVIPTRTRRPAIAPTTHCASRRSRCARGATTARRR
jgi:homospermidine synthase